MKHVSIKPEADDYTVESCDNYLNTQVTVPLVGDLNRGKVLKRELDRDGKPQGISNDNPMIDTRRYEL